MSECRTWNLRMNLDELNALVATMFTDFDRAQALQGIVIGCNGGSIPEDTSKSLRSGFEVGSKWLAEAMQFREKQRVGGKKSAENRAEKYGTPQPAPKCLRENTEVTSGNPRTNPQSTIYKDSTPLPPKRKRRMKQEIVLEFSEGAREVVNALVDIWPTEQPSDQKPIRTDLAQAGDRVDVILRDNAAITPEILIGAARIYLAEHKYSYRAMQFFFGPGGPGEEPFWRAYAKMAFRQQRDAQKVSNG